MLLTGRGSILVLDPVWNPDLDPHSSPDGLGDGVISYGPRILVSSQSHTPGVRFGQNRPQRRSLSMMQRTLCISFSDTLQWR